MYRLRGEDPDGGNVTFSISGDYLSVDRVTGVVTLVRKLDRESQRSIEIIITVTGDKVSPLIFSFSSHLLIVFNVPIN